MRDKRLTPEQERFAEYASEAYVEACPGAGKTCTIVARLAAISKELRMRRAVATLSFTNSAVEAFAKSCQEAGLGAFLRFPHYVGTFDAFVRHFIIVPSGIVDCRSRPIVVDSWETLGIDVRLPGGRAFRGEGVWLDDFNPETNVIDPARLGKKALRQHVAQYQADYQLRAAGRRQSLRRGGYLSAGDARVEARNRIQKSGWNYPLGRAIAARFLEVIVDEAQDCNPLDLEILSWLRGHGLRVTVVCDPDQAIYEFRNGTPGELSSFASKYADQNRLRLTGNFRSSEPICALAATLRSRQEADAALGESKSVRHPVVVAAYGGAVSEDIGRLFIERIESATVGISRAEVIVLAHRRRDAQTAAGNPMSSEASGTSKIEAVAREVREFWSPVATTRSRDAALRGMERLLLELAGLWQKGDHHPSPVIERSGLNRRQLRRQALEVIMRLPNTCEESKLAQETWVKIVQSEMIRLGLALPEGKTVPGFFRRPPNGKWTRHLQAPKVKQLSCSTIHEAKGRQYEAVCVVIRPDRAPENHTTTLIDAWRGRAELEAKRVIYVGVTRARKFVMLAVPQTHAERCCTILDDGRVPYVRVQA